jgi:hypothetical protein
MDLDPLYESIVVFINANDEVQTFQQDSMSGMPLALHPVQRESVDALVRISSFDPVTGEFVIPGRTVAVFVEYERPQHRIANLIDEVQELYDQGLLNRGQANALVSILESALRSLGRGNLTATVNQLKAFINDVNALLKSGRLTPEQGLPLIAAAQDIIWQIEQGL